MQLTRVNPRLYSLWLTGGIKIDMFTTIILKQTLHNRQGSFNLLLYIPLLLGLMALHLFLLRDNIILLIFLPGDSGYSDLWQIIFVTVPGTYVANTIMDVTTLLAFSSNTTTGPLVNCPVVPIGSSFASTGPGITLGWYKNQTINYFDFGLSVSYTIPIYVFPNVSGQNNLIDQVPGDPGYSAFWNAVEFTAPNGYVANTYKSQAEVDAAKLASINGPQAINCPVYMVDPLSTANPTSGAATATTGATSTTGGSFQLTVGILTMVLMYVI